MRGFDASDELYCLLLEHRKDETVTVGALGDVHWEKGWTLYVGRASYGWASRLKRFADPGSNPSPHWHVDYLGYRASARISTVVPVAEPGSRECDLAGWFDRRQELEVLAEGFGASDCRSDCGAHALTGTGSDPKLPERMMESPFSVRGMVQFRDQTCEWIPLKEP